MNMAILPNRLTRIDGLRAVAILMVIAAHVHNYFPSAMPGVGLGRYGPNLFFLVSGFILSYAASKPNYTPSSFYIRRFFRLAPLYYTVLAGCYIFGFNEILEPGVSRMPLDWRNVLWHLSFMHGLHPDYLRSIFGVMWSLTPEVVFYLIFPILFILPGFALIAAFLMALLMALWAGPIGLSIHGINGPAFRIWMVLSPLMNMYLFIFGMLVHRFESHFAGLFWRCIGIAGLVGFVLSDTQVPGLAMIHRTMRAVSSNHHFGYLMMAFPFLVTIQSSAARRILDNRAAQLLGQVSYSAFFIHYGLVKALAFCRVELSFSIAFLMIVLPLTIGLSYLSFRFVERPGIKIGGQLSHRFARSCYAPDCSHSFSFNASKD